MAKVRYDNKGRPLLANEYQKKDGRYEYRYTDTKGICRSVYSWTLKKKDRLQDGRKEGQCLRELEKQIERDIQDEIDAFAAQRLCLNAFFEDYIKDRPLKDSTRTNYKYMYGKYVRDGLGEMGLSEIKYSDILHFYRSLIVEYKFKPRSMEVLHTILHPIFTVAVRDGYIRVNPTDGAMKEMKAQNNWEKEKRHALTEEQQAAFVEYTSNSPLYKHWMPLFTVLLGTGGRIGEILGLRWQDCDFENGIITIDHTLIYRLQDNGKCKYRITTPKTKAGIREIPMFDEVREALLQERQQQMKDGFNEVEIEDYSGFIFTNRYKEVLSPHSVNRAIVRIIAAYNQQEQENAAKENRKPLLLPHFSAHHLRHTFCTRMCENTSDTNTLKVIQEIMGHADISTTLDVYTDLTRRKKQNAFAFLQGKMRLR